MEPIVVEFEVDASPAHAFDVWTSRPTMWWPRSHTVTRDPDLIVVFEPFPGGRVYERGSDGSEHEWGEILFRQPPTRVVYLWHLFFDRSEATEITVTFTSTDTGCRVRLEQVGFERLGEDVGEERRRRPIRRGSRSPADTGLLSPTPDPESGQPCTAATPSRSPLVTTRADRLEG